MSALAFLRNHWETLVQLAITVWLGSITRNFQITLAVHGTRLEAHREAVRRSLVLWWLNKDDPSQMDLRNEMIRWIAINDVFLSPAAAEAFHVVERYIAMKFSLGDRLESKFFHEADAALATLRRELLRFRKLTLIESITERWRSLRGKRRR